jgi:hypothetical protein
MPEARATQELEMKRRDFMIGAASATGLVFARSGWAQGNADKLSRIAIMSFGLNSIVKARCLAIR